MSAEGGNGMRLNDFVLTEHFNLIEFQCPCCHTALLQPLLVLRLEALRIRWGLSLIINSGYRCAKHNIEVGGVKNSLHRRGMAADIRMAADEQERFGRIALSEGFTKALAYPARGFIHLEIGENG